MKRTFAMVLAMVLLVVCTVGATLAWLNDDTELVTNTFTVGAISIDLDEADVDEFGDTIANADRVTENEYHLFPGRTYVKDPTVHVVDNATANSEDSWIFVEVANGLANIEAEGTGTIHAQILANGWTELTDASNTARVYYKQWTANDTDDAADDLVVFENFTLKDDLTADDLASYGSAQITIKGYAIQKQELDTAQAAWDALADALSA